jgi:hypothetical protein
MTISNAIGENPYTGNGSTATYGFTFAVNAATEVVVVETDTAGTSRTLTYGTEYSVTGVNVATGGTVTRIAGVLPSGYKWVIKSTIPLLQDTSIKNQSGFFPDVVERAFDRVVRMIQQVSNKVGRQITVPDTDAAIGPLPSAALRALKAFYFDAAGNPTVSGAVTTLADSALTLVVDTIAQLKGLAAPSSALTYIVRGYYAAGDGGGGTFRWNSGDGSADNGGTILQLSAGGVGRWNRIYDTAINVRWFGAKGDGATNDAPSIQAALNFSSNIWIPDGTYLLTAAILINKSGVVIQGSGRKNAVLKTSSGVNCVKITGGGIIKGVTIANCGFIGTTSSVDQILIDTSFVDVEFSNCDFMSNDIATPVFVNGAGVYLSGALAVGNNLLIDHCTFQGLQYGVSENATNIVGLAIKNCIFTDVFNQGVKLINADITNIEGCLVEGCNKNNGSPFAAVSVGTGATALYVRGCHFENNGGTPKTGIDISLAYGAGHVIESNHLNGTISASTSIYSIAVGSGVSALIHGNYFIEHTNGFLSLTAGNQAQVISNFPYNNAFNLDPSRLYVSGSADPVVYIEGRGDIIRASSLRNTQLKLTNGDFSEFYTNALAGIDVSYNGYLDGLTQYRNFAVWNGKQQNCLKVDGTTRITVFGNSSGPRGVARVEIDGNVAPYNDNVNTCGTSGYRWSVVYAATGAINTSDERQKQGIQAIDLAVLRAWSKVEYAQYKFNEAVETKGSSSRWHFGVIAQRVKEAFESEGLDPFAYGILCYDEWQDQYQEITDEKGLGTGEMSLVKKAGNLYGIRYEEALALECAYLRSRIK